MYSIDYVPKGVPACYDHNGNTAYYFVFDQNTLDINKVPCSRKRPFLHVPTFFVEKRIYEEMRKKAKEIKGYDIIEVIKERSYEDYVEVGFGFIKPKTLYI